MSTLKYILLVFFISGFGYSCEDGERDNFPTIRFTAIFDLRDPRYSGDYFSTNSFLDGYQVGIGGIIVYRAPTGQYYAFERMCPYEKQISCRIYYDPQKEAFVAECECCGSNFLINNEYGVRIEGPATRGLKSYRTSVKDSLLLVSSP